MKFRLLTHFSMAALSLVAVNALASETQVAGIYYDFDLATATAVVTYKGKCQCSGDTYQGVVNIPSSVAYEGQQYAVVAIGDYAFSNTRKLNKVAVPASIKSIGKGAFVGSAIEEVEFAPNSELTTIAAHAFLACKSLKTVQISQKVETIGAYAFELCDNLSQVTFLEPSSLTTIEEYVFCRTSIASMNLPQGVKSIGSVSYAQNPNMTAVFIPQSVTSISELNPFCYNTQLTQMVVEDGNKVYDSRNNCNGIIETKTNTLVAGCKATLIPASVTAIGRSSFNHCTELTEAVLPATLRSIGKYAYLGCTGLRSFYFPSTMTVMADSVFWQATNLDSIVTMAQRPFVIDESDFEPSVYDNATLYVPAGTASLYRSAPAWCLFRNIVEMDRFVVDGISYQLTADGQAQVVKASEGVPYSGTLIIPKQVQSGTQTYTVSGVSDSVSDGSEPFRIIRRDAMAPIANINIYGTHGQIKIEGSDAEARVYDAAGLMIISTTKRSIRVKQGIYVVECGGTTAKVAVD